MWTRLPVLRVVPSSRQELVMIAKERPNAAGYNASADNTEEDAQFLSIIIAKDANPQIHLDQVFG